MSEQNKHLPLEIAPAPDFKVSHVSGVTGGLSPEGGQMTFYVDMVKPAVDKKSGEMVPGSVVRTILFDARMSTELFRSMSQWMARHAEKYQAADCLDGSDSGE